MGGVERDTLRVKATGEVFTPTELVREILEQISNDQFQDPSKTFLDNSCGDGQFLGEILIRKLQSLCKEEITDIDFTQALSTVYGVDLMQDNVDECRKRLLCGSQDLKHIAIVEQNIYQADALKFSYNFEPMSATRRKREKLHRRRAEKAKMAAEQERIIKEREIKLFGKAQAKPKKVKSLVNVEEIK